MVRNGLGFLPLHPHPLLSFHAHSQDCASSASFFPCPSFSSPQPMPRKTPQKTHRTASATAKKVTTTTPKAVTSKMPTRQLLTMSTPTVCVCVGRWQSVKASFWQDQIFHPSLLSRHNLILGVTVKSHPGGPLLVFSHPSSSHHPGLSSEEGRYHQRSSQSPALRYMIHRLVATGRPGDCRDASWGGHLPAYFGEPHPTE